MSSKNPLTREGATRLARKIIAYWSERGYSPEVWLEEITAFDAERNQELSLFAVRSNMVGGRPVLA